jgi:hypothetical protein
MTLQCRPELKGEQKMGQGVGFEALERHDALVDEGVGVDCPIVGG